MPLHIIERPALTVMGLHIVTRPMSPDIPALWPRFMSRVSEIERPSEPNVTYGVMKSEPGDMSRLDYWSAIAVSSTARTPAGMESLVLPAGHYAQFRYPLSGLGDGFGEIFNKLLPASDYVQTPGPLFERYNEAFEPSDPSSIVEIFVPVQRKGG